MSSNSAGTKVLFFAPVPPIYLEDLGRRYADRGYTFSASTSDAEATDLARGADILVTMRPLEPLISAAVNCGWIHSLSAGVENYLKLDALRKGKVTLTNSAGVYAESIAEHAMAMILFRTRRLDAAFEAQREGRWANLSYEESQGQTSETEVQGKTMGIAGLGHTGLEIARRAKPFGMKVAGTRRHPSDTKLRIEEYRHYVDHIYSGEKLDEMLAESDVVVNALPLTDETRQLFNSGRFSKFKPGAIFVNVGRGETVVERDLIDALNQGIVGFAALDVFEVEPLPGDSPLWRMSNVLISPHYAGTSQLTAKRAMGLFEKNLKRYAAGEALLNVVDKNLGY